MQMDDSAKKIKPIGDRVLLKFVEVEKKEAKSKSGLILPGKYENKVGQQVGSTGGTVFRAYVDSVGEKVDLEEVNFKIGDFVIFNNHDVMNVNLPNPEDSTKIIIYGITKPESIWGVYEE